MDRMGPKYIVPKGQRLVIGSVYTDILDPGNSPKQNTLEISRVDTGSCYW